MLKQLGSHFSKTSRRKRTELFTRYLRPAEEDRILDLGSVDGSFIAGVIPFRKNVYIADIDAEHLQRGKETYGFKAVLLDESGRIPFPDGYFDIVFCFAVIEHVTVDKRDIPNYKTARQFADAAFVRQRRLANEIRRVGKRYFVTTANKHFPIEGHTWLPFFVAYLPRPTLVKLVQFMNKWWPKKDFPDWSLLTPGQMSELFPDAEIVAEKWCGFTKSVIAIKRETEPVPSPVSQRQGVLP